MLALFSGVIHYSGSYFYFYWTYWWYDFLVHFSVGFTGGLSLYWGFFESGLIFKRRPRSELFSLLLVFAAVMTWALGWEWYEWVYAITDSHESAYHLDVINDLIMGGGGGLLAAFWASRTKNG